jgi:hypothetical protein
MATFLERIAEVVEEFKTGEEILVRQMQNIQTILKLSQGNLPKTQGDVLWANIRVIIGKLKWLRNDYKTFLTNVKTGKWK